MTEKGRTGKERWKVEISQNDRNAMCKCVRASKVLIADRQTYTHPDAKLYTKSLSVLPHMKTGIRLLFFLFLWPSDLVDRPQCMNDILRQSSFSFR